MKCYNNKIYSKDTTTNERLLKGDLILNNDNITITYGDIKRIIFNSSLMIEDFSGNKYKGHKCNDGRLFKHPQYYKKWRW